MHGAGAARHAAPAAGTTRSINGQGAQRARRLTLIPARTRHGAHVSRDHVSPQPTLGALPRQTAATRETPHQPHETRETPHQTLTLSRPIEFETRGAKTSLPTQTQTTHGETYISLWRRDSDLVAARLWREWARSRSCQREPLRRGGVRWGWDGLRSSSGSWARASSGAFELRRCVRAPSVRSSSVGAFELSRCVRARGRCARGSARGRRRRRDTLPSRSRRAPCARRSSPRRAQRHARRSSCRPSASSALSRARQL